MRIKKIIKKIIKYFEFSIIPFIFISALILKKYRKLGSKNLPLSTTILKKIGVFPILNHYYEPLFNHSNQNKLRNLPGVSFNFSSQLKLLEQLNYHNDFYNFISAQKKSKDQNSFKINNGNFETVDAEFLFKIVRHLKPGKIIEIGCGESTKIINHALSINKNENYNSEHICIEPYEQPWLEKFSKINLIRSKIEDLNINWKSALNTNDMLFIDSSHIIRPNGDVLYEYLNILPQLQRGVIVHIHDIFTPYDYPIDWMYNEVRFFNEQYLLEALLENNSRYKIYASLNYLKKKYPEQLKKVCTTSDDNIQPGSFYILVK